MSPHLQAKNVFEILPHCEPTFPSYLEASERDCRETAEITAINTNGLKQRSKTVTIIHLLPSPLPYSRDNHFLVSVTGPRGQDTQAQHSGCLVLLLSLL